MKRVLPVFFVSVLYVFFALPLMAQSSSGVLNPTEVKKVAPSTYFFMGQSATTQARNSAGFSVSGKLVLAGLVDTAGYSGDVQAKYRGFLITEIKLDVEGHNLPPGQYGFGFKDGKFILMDVGGNNLLNVASHTDTHIERAVPLKITASGAGYRLYVGKEWVELKAE